MGGDKGLGGRTVRIISIIGTGSAGADQEITGDSYRILDSSSKLPGVTILAGYKTTLREEVQGVTDTIGVVAGDTGEPGDRDGLAIQNHGKKTGQRRTFQEVEEEEGED